MPGPGRPFKKGHDAARNLGGRPRGLAHYAQAQTKDGTALVDFYMRVFLGKEIVDGKKPTLKERMEAAAWLADRGFGKPVQTVESNVRRTTIFKGPEAKPPDASEERAFTP